MVFSVPALLADMVAAILALGLLVGPESVTIDQLAADPQHPTPTTYAQLAACPPCADQLPPGARVLATASAPPDAAGTVESVVAYFVRDPSFTGTELGRVGALAVRNGPAGSQAFKLSEDLGETSYAEVVARDLTGDGAPELAITGGVGAHSTVLRIFRWNGSGYGMVEEFFGDSGVRLVDVDGDGLEEVIVGMRHYDRAQTRSDTIMRWTGAGYDAAYTEWGFAFDSPEFHDYPEATTLDYYLAIDRRDFRTAWDLLGSSMREGQSFDAFVGGFATTQHVRVEDLELVKEDDAGATVRVELSSIERDGSLRRFGGTWIVQQAGGSWRLVGASITPL